MKQEPWDTLQNQLWHTAGCSFCSADQLPLSTIFQLLWHNLLVTSHCCQLQWCKTAVVLTLVTLSLIWAIRIAKERTWSPSLWKRIVSPILKEIRSWNYLSIYSKMRDFALLRLQALFVSDHANAQDRGSGWLKDMGFCLHKQKICARELNLLKPASLVSRLTGDTGREIQTWCKSRLYEGTGISVIKLGLNPVSFPQRTISSFRSIHKRTVL